MKTKIIIAIVAAAVLAGGITYHASTGKCPLGQAMEKIHHGH